MWTAGTTLSRNRFLTMPLWLLAVVVAAHAARNKWHRTSTATKPGLSDSRLRCSLLPIVKIHLQGIQNTARGYHHSFSVNIVHWLHWFNGITKS